MNKLFYSLMLAAVASPAFASIDTVNYQALVRNEKGEPVANTNVGVRFQFTSGDNTL